MGMDKIVVSHLTKDIKKNRVLEDVCFEVERGSICGFVGANGSGKSMLFRAISGLIRPTSGTVQVFSQVLGRDGSFPESMGIVIENVGFWPEYAGLQNLQLLASIKKNADEKALIEALNRVGLNPEDKRAYKKYSLGMKQRLAIAQAIMEKPDLLILDEPTNALDEEGIEQIRKVISEENQRGATVLIASHNRQDIQLLCNKCFRMYEGRLYPEEAI